MLGILSLLGKFIDIGLLFGPGLVAGAAAKAQAQADALGDATGAIHDSDGMVGLSDGIDTANANLDAEYKKRGM